MTFVPRSRILPRAFWRPAMVFFAVSQMVLAFAPILEGRLGASTRAHVESAGTATHHAHDEANCSACVARQLLSSTELPARHEEVLDGTSPQPVPACLPFCGSSSPPSTRPRAPPSVSV